MVSGSPHGGNPCWCNMPNSSQDIFSWQEARRELVSPVFLSPVVRQGFHQMTILTDYGKQVRSSLDKAVEKNAKPKEKIIRNERETRDTTKFAVTFDVSLTT